MSDSKGLCCKIVTQHPIKLDHKFPHCGINEGDQIQSRWSCNLPRVELHCCLFAWLTKTNLLELFTGALRLLNRVVHMLKGAERFHLGLSAWISFTKDSKEFRHDATRQRAWGAASPVCPRYVTRSCQSHMSIIAISGGAASQQSAQ